MEEDKRVEEVRLLLKEKGERDRAGLSTLEPSAKGGIIQDILQRRSKKSEIRQVHGGRGGGRKSNVSRLLWRERNIKLADPLKHCKQEKGRKEAWGLV